MRSIALDINGLHVLSLIRRDGASVLGLVSDGSNRRSDLRWALIRHLQVVVDGRAMGLDGRTGRVDLPLGAQRLEVFLGADLKQCLAVRLLGDEGVVGEDSPLSAFASRYLADNGVPHPQLELPERFAVPTSDLHSHLAGCLSPRDLLALADEHRIAYEPWRLEKAGIQSEREQQVADLPREMRRRLQDSLAIRLDRPVPFRKLQTIYNLRNPITKSKRAFPDFLMRMAKDYRAMGVTYVEQSFHQVAFPDWLELVHQHTPRVERETGLTIRYLAAFGRDDDPPWIRDYLKRIQRAGRSRYLVGLDVNGHEANSTRVFQEHLTNIADWAHEQRPGFVIRVHAGENVAHPENIRLAVQAVQGRDIQLRIGHGLYGVDDETLDLLRRERAMVEFNLNSNFALNNIQAIDASEAPIMRYLHRGVSVVLGTDGYGIYQTDLRQEAQAALQCGISVSDLDGIRVTEEAYAQKRHEWDKACTDQAHVFAVPEDLPESEQEYDGQRTGQERDRERADRRQALRARLEELGIALLKREEVFPLLRKKRVVSFAGAWRKSWLRVSEEQQQNVLETVRALLDAWNPRTTVLVTGGTRYGLEELVQREGRARGFSVLATLVWDTPAESLDGDGVSHGLIIDRSLYSKAAGLYRLIKDHHGWCFFIGGGAIVGDEIQTAKGLHLRLLLMDGPEGASTEHARRMPQAAFSDAKEALEKMQAQRPVSDLWYEGPNPASDLVVIREVEGERQVLLIRRQDDRRLSSGEWALPGGFQPSRAEMGQAWQAGAETARQTAVRELREETGLNLAGVVNDLIWVGRYDDRSRDPRNTDRTWVESTAFAVFIEGELAHLPVAGGDDAGEAGWSDVHDLPGPLAFDHEAILDRALKLIQGKDE